MIYALGPFRLDTRDNLLFRGNEPLPLGRRAVALLRALVERPGALVTKDTLIEAAWPGQAVEESNLTVQIASLRRVLGEVPGGDRWIETMPRRGYRFIAPAVAEAAGVIAPPPPARDPAPPALPSPRADAERRQIIAMSCELIGAEASAGDGDLEDLLDAIAAFQGSVSETVERHGGFAVDHLGNTALVLFGYPAAHEHAAEQAVRAGLALCAAAGATPYGVGAQLRCRVGVATGMAIVGDLSPVGAGARREIVGDAPNLAMRLRLAAQPGTVAIEPLTRRLIGGLFECLDFGTIDAPAGTAPVPAWRVLGETVTVSRFEALRGPPLTRLVGREDETNVLRRLWSRAIDGEGQVALVSGEAGLGKSRLTVGLEESLYTEPHFTSRCFCSPHHQDSPLFPFTDQLERDAGFIREDTPASRLEKLLALAARAGLPEEDAAFLLDLLLLPLPEGQSLPSLAPARKRQRVLEALCRQLEGLARQQPVVAIFEDAHWIDATSRELLDMIVERTSDLKLLLVVTFRPEFQPPWAGQPRVTMLALNRLDRRDRIALLTQVAGKTLPSAVIDQIADRTDGVPLFVEELTKTVLESGLLRAETDRYVIDGAMPPVAIPTSLYASLLARLNRQKSARLAAQIGAAIGREFTYGLLRTVWDRSEDELRAALARLVESELVYQRGTPPDAVYSFKHALVRDAAYGSLLRGARRKLHGSIAEALRTQSAELTQTQPELFAWHYAEAGLAEQSAEFWASAGQRSAARSALAEAAAQYQKALDQLALLPVSPEHLRRQLELRVALGAVLIAVRGFTAAETGESYAHAGKLWEQLGAPSEFLQVPYGQALFHAVRGEFDLARHLDADLLRLSRERNDTAGLVMAHWSSGRDLLFIGDFEASRAHLEQALALYDPVAHQSLVDQAGFHFQVVLRAYLAIVVFCLGFPDQARDYSGAALAEARLLTHPPSLVTSLTFHCRLLSLIGDDTPLQAHADEVDAVSFEQGLPYWRAIGTIYQGWGKAKQGDMTEAVTLLRGGLDAYRSTGAQTWAPHHLALLASAYEIAGRTEESLAALAEALEVVETTGERWLAAEVHRQHGDLLLHRGNSAGAEALYRTALTIAVEQRAKSWELRAATCLARMRRDEGRDSEARDILAPVRDWFSEGFDTAGLNQADALLAELT